MYHLILTGKNYAHQLRTFTQVMCQAEEREDNLHMHVQMTFDMTPNTLPLYLSHKL